MKNSEWKSIQRKVTTTIRLILALAIKYTILNETTPTKMWKKLEKIVKVINQSLELKDRLVHIENKRMR